MELIKRHTRCFAAPPEAVRTWLEQAWSGGLEDIFPWDYIPDWRHNPEGTEQGDLRPGATRLGHGPFRFVLTAWDGWTWRVRIEGQDGWHGFDLEAWAGGSRLTHTLCLPWPPLRMLFARFVLVPVHDWAVEAMFDRLDVALVQGHVPFVTPRPLPGLARISYGLLNWRRVRAIHSRHLDCPSEAVRPWLDLVWSGTDRDVFPRDVVPTYRHNPPTAEPLALIAGETRLGHGPARFLFELWDGSLWRARFLLRRLRGWQGFCVEREGQGCRLTHVVDVRLHGRALLDWPLMWAPMHDWAIEALFDRLQVALASGQVPSRTQRPVPALARWLQRLGWFRPSRP
jgi:hypothetical protein